MPPPHIFYFIYDLLDDSKDVLTKWAEIFAAEQRVRLKRGDDSVQGRAVTKLLHAQAEQLRAAKDEHRIKNSIAATTLRENQQRQSYAKDQLHQLNEQALEMERQSKFIERRIGVSALFYLPLHSVRILLTI